MAAEWQGGAATLPGAGMPHCQVAESEGCEMKLSVTAYVYEPPALTITPETEYESAILSRYWESAKLGKGCARESADGFSYTIKFSEREVEHGSAK